VNTPDNKNPLPSSVPLQSQKQQPTIITGDQPPKIPQIKQEVVAESSPASISPDKKPGGDDSTTTIAIGAQKKKKIGLSEYKQRLKQIKVISYYSL
jgi:hypothetical protein